MAPPDPQRASLHASETQDLADMAALRDRLGDKFETLHSKLREKDEEMESLRRKLSSKDEELECLQSKLGLKDEVLADLRRTQCEDLQAAQENSQENKQALQASNDALKGEVSELRGLMTHQAARMVTLERQLGGIGVAVPDVPDVLQDAPPRAVRLEANTLYPFETVVNQESNDGSLRSSPDIDMSKMIDAITTSPINKRRRNRSSFQLNRNGRSAPAKRPLRGKDAMRSALSLGDDDSQAQKPLAKKQRLESSSSSQMQPVRAFTLRDLFADVPNSVETVKQFKRSTNLKPTGTASAVDQKDGQKSGTAGDGGKHPWDSDEDEMAFEMALSATQM